MEYKSGPLFTDSVACGDTDDAMLLFSRIRKGDCDWDAGEDIAPVRNGMGGGVSHDMSDEVPKEALAV